MERGRGAGCGDTAGKEVESANSLSEHPDSHRSESKALPLNCERLLLLLPSDIWLRRVNPRE